MLRFTRSNRSSHKGLSLRLAPIVLVAISNSLLAQNQLVFAPSETGQTQTETQAGKEASDQGFEPYLPQQPKTTWDRYGQPGTIDRCNYSVDNPAIQPQVAHGRCLPKTIAIDCADNCGGHQTWRDLHPYDFRPLGHGEYLGPIRLPSVMDNRVRVGDRLIFIFARNRERPVDTYLLLVGDELQISSFADDKDFPKIGDLTQGRGVAIQPDGYLHLNAVGRVRAAGLTIAQLRRNLEQAYKDVGGFKEPAIDVIPIKTNTQQDDILESIDARQGFSGGRTLAETVQPDGTVRLIPIGAVCVLGLTLDEVKREVNLRYQQIVPGLHVEPRMDVLAPHFVYVYGEVAKPNRYELNGPTSVTQMLAMAGGINPRGNAREIVVFSRAEDWRLLATRLDLKGMHLGKVPTPADEIWMRDSDLIIVPATPIARFDDFVDQVFTKGAYGIFRFAQIGSGFTVVNFSGN